MHVCAVPLRQFGARVCDAIEAFDAFFRPFAMLWLLSFALTTFRRAMLAFFRPFAVLCLLSFALTAFRRAMLAFFRPFAAFLKSPNVSIKTHAIAL